MFSFRFGGADPLTISTPWFPAPKGADPFTGPVPHFPHPDGSHNHLFRDLQSEKFHISSSWASCRVFLRFPDVVVVLSSTLWCRLRFYSPSSDITAFCCLGPLIPFCLPGSSVVSSWASLLFGFLAQPCRWSNYFLRISPCALPLLHRGTPSCMRQPTSFGIHNLLGSVPLASRVVLQLDASPCATSYVLHKIALRLLPWGPLDAPLRTTAFLGLTPVFSGLVFVASWQAVLSFRPSFLSAIQASIFSWCSVSGSMSSEDGSLHSRRASVVS
jgi:hypothetical protein